jgi:hypothetical protein
VGGEYENAVVSRVGILADSCRMCSDCPNGHAGASTCPCSSAPGRTWSLGWCRPSPGCSGDWYPCLGTATSRQGVTTRPSQGRGAPVTINLRAPEGARRTSRQTWHFGLAGRPLHDSGRRSINCTEREHLILPASAAMESALLRLARAWGDARRTRTSFRPARYCIAAFRPGC